MFGYGFGGLELVVMPLALIGIVLLGIVALAGGRNEPDPHGHRAPAMYLSLVSFVAIFTILFAIGTGAKSLGNLVFTDPGSVDCSEEPWRSECMSGGPTSFVNLTDAPSDEAVTAEHVSGLVNSVGAGAAAGAVLAFHARRRRELLEDDTFAGSPGARTFNAYLYAVAFVAMIVLLVSAATALLGLVRGAAPDLVNSGSVDAERDAGLVQLISSLALGAAAVAVYKIHWAAARGTGSAPPGV